MSANLIDVIRFLGHDLGYSDDQIIKFLQDYELYSTLRTELTRINFLHLKEEEKCKGTLNKIIEERILKRKQLKESLKYKPHSEHKTLKDRLRCIQQERYNLSLKTSPYPLKVSSATNWVQYYTTEKEE